MTSQIDSVASHLQKGKHNETKGGTGHARPGPGGVMTPDPTPELDEARTNADLKRRQEDASQGTEGNGIEFSTTREPHPDETVVSQSRDNEHRKILGVSESYEDAYEEEREVLDAFWERGMIAHPKFSKDKDAEKTFKMILEAGAALGVDDDQIQQLKEWEGEEEEEEDNGDGMHGVDHGVPVPHKIIVGIYQEATPHLAQLQKYPKSKAAAQNLNILNDKIKKQNEKDEIDPSDQWIIRYQELAEIYQKARPAIDRVLKDSNDSEAKIALEEHSKTLNDIIKLNHYLDWNINLDIAALEKPRVRARSPAPIDSTPIPPKAVPVDSTPTAPATVPADSTPTAPATVPADSTPTAPAPTPDSAPARLQAAQKIQSETLQLWAKMGWSIYKMSDGDTILSHKALSREGKEPYAYEVTVMTQDSPYFQIKLGSEVGRREMDAYLALPKIYKIVTDPGDDNKPVYTWRQKSKYDRLLWTATKPRKQTQAGKNPRTGDTQCCVVWKDGTVSEMARAQFTKVTTENEKKAIEKYCRSVEIKAPWEMDPKTLTVSAASTLGQQLLQAGRTSSDINLNPTALKVATSNAENPGAVSSILQNSFTALQSTLEAFGSRFEQNQIMMQQLMNQQIMMREQLEQQAINQMKFTGAMTEVLRNVIPAQAQGSTSEVKTEPLT